MNQPFVQHFPIMPQAVTTANYLRPDMLLRLLQAVTDVDLFTKFHRANPCEDPNFVWMTRGYHIRLQRPLKLGDHVTFTTFCGVKKDLYCCRRFNLSCQSEKIGYADSSWIIVNKENRRPQRLSRCLPSAFFEPTQPEATENFEQLETKLDLPTQASRSRIHARRSDFDRNGHVNNTKYLEWFAETIPSSIYDHYGLIGLDLMYLHEVKETNPELTLSPLSPRSFAHGVYDQEGNLCVRGTTLWGQ